MVRESIGAPRADAATYSGGASTTADAISAPAPPEPSNDDDELFQLGERIAELAARINAAESRMMTLIADFDRRGGWKDGFGSCAEWLAWRIGIKIGPRARKGPDGARAGKAAADGRCSEGGEHLVREGTGAHTSCDS